MKIIQQYNTIIQQLWVRVFFFFPPKIFSPIFSELRCFVEKMGKGMGKRDLSEQWRKFLPVFKNYSLEIEPISKPEVCRGVLVEKEVEVEGN